MLRRFDHLPEGLLDTPANGLNARLGGPTLITLDGARKPPLFVSCLLHGNEVSGWLAVRQMLRRQLAKGPLPRRLVLFIGNVAAAETGVRRLEGQPDFNRVWPFGSGRMTAAGPEAEMVARITEEVRGSGCFASIDLHNNTGANPLYACVNRRGPAYLSLALLFSRTLVYFTEPKGVQSIAFADFCPATTVEAGRPGEPAGIARAGALVEAALATEHWPQRPPPPQDYALHRTVATVYVPPDRSFDFSRHEAELSFPLTLESANFQSVPPGTPFARVRPGSGARLTVRDQAGRDAFDRFFTVDGDVLRLKRPVIPSMLTSNARIIRQDCLCYFMDRIEAAMPAA